MKKNSFILLMFFLSFTAYGQKAKETTVPDNVKRALSKTELRFMSAKIDSIKFNLNQMIMFEKELRQRNFYLNEKTALVDELVSSVQALQKNLDVVNLRTSDVKTVFGSPSHKSPSVWIYEIETFESNCPFIQITFYVQQNKIGKMDYKITDCQKWK